MDKKSTRKPKEKKPVVDTNSNIDVIIFENTEWIKITKIF